MYIYVYAQLLPCPNLCDPMDRLTMDFMDKDALQAPPLIFQARILEWIAISSSKYIYLYIYTHTHIYIHTDVCMCVCVCVCVYTH